MLTRRSSKTLTKVLGAPGVALAVTALASPANAQVYVTTQPVYAQPPPVYVQPQPVYAQPQPVYAQPQPVYVQPRVYAHSVGFFFRGGIGLGYGNFSTSASVGDVRFSGLAVQLDLGLGFAFTREFALHLDVAGASLASPSLSVGSAALSTSSGISATTSLVGVGGTYYLMPANLYVSGTIGAAILAAEIPTTAGYRRAESGIGWGVNVMAGKEWFIGGSWSLGVAAQLIYTRTPDTDTSSTVYWNNLAAGALFSATLY